VIGLYPGLKYVSCASSGELAIGEAQSVLNYQSGARHAAESFAQLIQLTFVCDVHYRAHDWGFP
jgi:hypothetical protein